MSHLEKSRSINKFLEMCKHPYISIANKRALSDLWGDVWHRIGIEWPKNRVLGEKFVKRIYHADSSSLETICQLAKECGLKQINRIDENEIELVASDAEDYSIVISQGHYDASLNYDYSDLEGLSIAEAIDNLKAKLNNKCAPFYYISLHFKTPSEITGLRTKILTQSPRSEGFREFLMVAKSKLEITAETLHNAVDMSEEPIKSNAQAEREVIMQNLKERYTLMAKRHAFLKAMVSPFNSTDEFVKNRGEWCAIVGINLAQCVNYLEITINLEDGDYETYFAIPSMSGHLIMSEIVRWQDDYCANTLLNITTQEVAAEGEILYLKN